MNAKYIRVIALAVAGFVVSTLTVSATPAQFVIVNINAPGVGFNDPTPVAPIGGNTGTTLGEQRMIALQHAAQIWSAQLDSNIPIRIRARFVPLGPGVLGSASAAGFARNFPNAPLAGTWYHIALANKLADMDLAPTVDDINVNFSSDFNFYLGLDNNHGNRNDLVAVLLHEFAHGLGFSQTASLSTGALFIDGPDSYNTLLFDTTFGKYWPQLTNAERLASATRSGRVVFDGPTVTAGIPSVLSLGSPTVEVNSPASIAGPYQFGVANFGPPIGSPNVSAPVVAAVDAVEVGGTATDGCTPFENAGAVAGRIALIERGLCGFAVKARNATAAGAVAAIIYNQAANAGAAPPGMADDGLGGILIPTVSLTRADGLAILGQLAGGVSMDIGVDLTVRAGADALGRARVFAPFPVAAGSSISHYDTVASRNLLMEPNISADLTHNVKAPDDLTLELLRDVGWYADADGDLVADGADCEPNSDRRATIVIGGIDTGVQNRMFTNGCTSADLIAHIAAAAGNHGGFVAGVAHLTNAWKDDGLITASEKGTLQSAAARSGQ